jgi:hypothetical protein
MNVVIATIIHTTTLYTTELDYLTFLATCGILYVWVEHPDSF